MNTERVKKFSISIITGVAFVAFCVILFQAIFYIPSEEIPVSQSTLQEIAVEKSNLNNTAVVKSTRKVIPKIFGDLTIPRIHVSAKIQEVGITKNGNMAGPNNFRDVGWYKYGPLPGNTGTALIAGHVDNGIALPAVFSRLGELKKGDDIYIQTTKSESLHFVVTEINEYDFNTDTDLIFSESKEKLLKLITCTGTWIPQFKTHDKRLVVTARLLEE